MKSGPNFPSMVGRAVLADGVRQRQPIAVIEASERHERKNQPA